MASIRIKKAGCVDVFRLTWLLLCLLCTGTAWAGGEIGWSHSTLTGEEAKQRFLSDSEQCMDYAKLLAESPAISGADQAAADADGTQAKERLRKHQIKKAMACMSTRGWSATPNPRLNAGS